MPRRRLTAGVWLLLAFAFTGTASAGQPLQTGLLDPVNFAGPAGDQAFAVARAAGVTVVRLPLFWVDVVPRTARKPRGFDTGNPGDPNYNWAAYDRMIQQAIAHGLEPIVNITTAPPWARRRYPSSARLQRVDPLEFGRFALAAARRYSGLFRGLPRLRYWQAWNEPNNVGRAPLKVGAADWYRAMVNEFASAVHSVHPDNVVIAGGLSPLTKSTVIGPLRFMRDVLCLSGSSPPRPTCRAVTRFEIWSMHPYTSGDPLRRAAFRDDIALGNLSDMRRLLDAAVGLHHVRSRRPIRFWVTEFSWDTNPPDPAAVPIHLQARWTAEALYRMWADGVTLVTWWRLRDDPLHVSPYQSGLYFCCQDFTQPKPTLQAFRFPFVALPEGSSVLVWGRTPDSSPRPVTIEQSFKGGWKRLTVLRADEHGIFTARVHVSDIKASLRAQIPSGSDSSLPFSLLRPPDHYYPPFGS